MRARSTARPEPVPTHVRRRAAALSLLQSFAVSTSIVVAYFALPLDSAATPDLVRLTIGLIVVAALLVWQVREIARSSYPLARAVGALGVSVPLFLAVFATTYYVMGLADPGSWSEPLSKLDSLYFVVTVFATVGFGDITAVSEPARAVTTLQMLGDIVLVGLIARVIVGAVQRGLDRRRSRPLD